MAQDWTGVRERVLALRLHPRRDVVLGHNAHMFIVEPALSAADVVDLEDWLGFRLPADYRGFLTDVGAGGAGPECGIFPVRRHPEGGWAWDGGDGWWTYEPSELAAPFPAAEISTDVLEELRAAAPFEDDFDDDEQFERADEAWQEREAAILFASGRTAGTVSIADVGCGLFYRLVVSGPAAGAIWYDPRIDGDDLCPLPGPDGAAWITFGRWYMDWLADAERAVAT